MNDDRDADRRRLEGFFRDELREAEAEAPSFDELAAYVEGQLSPADSAELEERIAGDDVLKREVELLRELRAELARPAKPAPARSRWVWTGLAAAASLAAAVSLLVLRPRPRPVDPRAGTPTVASVATLRDGDETLLLSDDGTVRGLAGVDPDLRAAAGSALRGELPAPADLSALRSGRSALLGQPSTPAAFAPEAPVGTRVATGQPTFRWSAHPGATAYDVKVFDQDFREQAAGVDVAGTQWQPSRPLAPGRVYLWQVTARTSHGRVSAPAPPQPEARFEVADDALLAQVARRRGGAPSSHLVAALAFVEAGLLDEAEAELQALAAANPGNAPVAALRERLRRMR